MATSRSFAYNPSTTPPTGATQFGNIAVEDVGFNQGGGIRWFNGPDEDTGYVICHESGNRTVGSQSEVISGTAIGFWRTSTKSDIEFLNLVSVTTGQSFLTASVAKDWLHANGYWSSWVSSGPTLLVNLDASNNSSYGGSGNTWYDLISNNDGTLNAGSGTITYGTTNGGEFTLSGATNTRIEFTDNSDISLSATSTKAYVIWINASRVGFVSFSDTIMSKQSGNPAGDGFWVGINSSNQLVGRVTSDGGSTNKYISGIGDTISTGTWYMISLIVKVSSDSDTFKMFINTTEVGSTSGGGSSVNDTNDLYLGNYHTGLQNARSFQGKIGEFYVHEGDFTSSDVSTLFDNTKTRFGY
jgi:hypothetical protein